MKQIPIGNRLVGPEQPPFIVAEMSGNHDGSLDRALAIIGDAARAGAHAVKLQTYTADTMTLDVDGPGFRVEDPDSLWHGEALHQLYQKAHTPWDWHPRLFQRCRELEMVCFSSPFDDTAVDLLEDLDTPCYKIASFENVDLALIRRVAATGKPLILSTGMATAAELDDAVRTARAAGCEELILLKCTSSYPADPGHSNLATIPALGQLFNCQVGLSDHTLGLGAALAAVALGASVIEKHVTLSRADDTVDAAFSLEPSELQSLVVESERAWKAMGKVHFGPTEPEVPSLVFRRSLYVVADMRAGDVFAPDNIRAIRPGLGLAPKFLECFLGKKIARDASVGTPLDWTLIDQDSPTRS